MPSSWALTDARLASRLSAAAWALDAVVLEKFETREHLLAKRSDQSVSSPKASACLQHVTTWVREFPPKLDLRSVVRRDSR
jgi:hypothetical protein